MKRITLILAGSVLVLACAAAAFAQSTDPVSSSDKNAPSASSTTPAPDPSPTPAAESTPAASAETSTKAHASAPPASNPAIDKVRERGMKASAKERTDVEKKLDLIEKEIQTEATTKGDAEIAGRISSEFGMTADALTAERAQYARGWGELLVAHTLMANAKTDATLTDLFTMRSQGMGWGAIAAGMNLQLGDVVTAMKSEQRVAMGLEKGDGKPAMIASGSATTKVKANAKPSAKAEVKASAAGVGVGGGVDINKATGK